MSRQLELDFHRADNSIRHEVHDLLSPSVKWRAKARVGTGTRINDGAQISTKAGQDKSHTQTL